MSSLGGMPISLFYTKSLGRPSEMADWDLKLLRNSNDKEVERIVNMISVLNQVRLCDYLEDRRIWELES